MNVKYVYHDGKDSATTIYFGPHFKKEKQGDKWVDTTQQVGFGLRVVKTDKQNKENKDQLSISFTYAETELLARYLEDGLCHIFGAWYAENINRNSEKKEKPKKTTTQEEAQSEQNSPPEEAPDF
jgi:hypothetical protein